MNGKSILIAAAALALALPASADDTVRTLQQKFDAASVQQLGLEFPVGELVVEAWDNPQVAIEVRLECDVLKKQGCREAAEAVKLATSTRGGELHLELKGWPKTSSRGLQANVRVHAPRRVSVDAELGVGELRITGIESNVQAELGVGDIDLNLPEKSVGTVQLEAGVGDARLTTSQKSYTGSGLVGKELHWKKGTGRADVRVECGVGDVRVALK